MKNKQREIVVGMDVIEGQLLKELMDVSIIITPTEDNRLIHWKLKIKNIKRKQK